MHPDCTTGTLSNSHPRFGQLRGKLYIAMYGMHNLLIMIKILNTGRCTITQTMAGQVIGQYTKTSLEQLFAHRLIHPAMYEMTMDGDSSALTLVKAGSLQVWFNHVYVGFKQRHLYVGLPVFAVRASYAIPHAIRLQINW